MTHSSKPLVSIVMPARNAAATIESAICSVQTQTMPDWELFVIDDGSTDDTAVLVKELARSDRRIHLAEQSPSGVSAARNRGLRDSTGQFISWLDADDAFEPHYLQQAVETLRASGPRTIVTTDAVRLTPAGLTRLRILPRPFPPSEAQRNAILEANFVGVFSTYPRELHDAIGFLDESLSYGEDRDLWSRALFSGWQVVRAPRPAAIYRWAGGSASNNPARGVAGERVVLEKIRRDFAGELTARQRAFLDARLVGPSPRTSLTAADAALRARDYASAARHLKEARVALPSDRRLRVRALLAGTEPTAWLLRWKLLRSDRRIGWHDGMDH